MFNLTESKKEPKVTDQPATIVDTANVDFSQLSKKEAQTMITPDAFVVNQALFGVLLATPKQRLLAMMVDGVLIAIMSTLSPVFIVLFAAIATFKAKSNVQIGISKQMYRRVLRTIGGIFAVLVVLSLVTDFDLYSDNVAKVDANNITLSQAFTQAALYGPLYVTLMTQIDNDDCMKQQCWRATLNELTTTAAEQGIGVDTFKSFTQETLSELTLSADQQAQELQRLVKLFNEKSPNKATELAANSPASTSTPASIPAPAPGAAVTDPTDPIVAPVTEAVPASQTPKPRTKIVTFGDEPLADKDKKEGGVIGFIRDFIENDLGFGFGWAALYFTLFTALWRGQTPGKKLFNIRVIQLSGKALTLWDAFGRYGGYVAGFATGLLGFAQVKWDPNRQAIHDKISATVVIKGDVPLALKLANSGLANDAQ